MDSSIVAFLTALAFGFILFCIEVIVFLIYRQYRSKPIYLESKVPIQTPVFSESTTPITKLLKKVWSVPLQEISSYCGIEAKIFLSLHYLITIFFAVLCITSAIVLIPIYVTGTNTVEYQLDIIGIAHVLGSGDVLWGSAMFLVGFSALGYTFVYYYLKQALQRGNSYEEISLNLDSFVIQVSNLPWEMNPHYCQQQVKNVLREWEDIILDIYVVPNYTEAYIVQKELNEAKHQLERAQEYDQNYGEPMVIRKGLFRKKIVAEPYYQELVGELQQKYNDLIGLGDQQTAGIGFILCDTPTNAQNLIKNFKGTDQLNSKNWKLVKATTPQEIIWENMKGKPLKLLFIRIAIQLIFIVFFFFLVSPALMAFILIWMTQDFSPAIQGTIKEYAPALMLFTYQSIIVRHASHWLVNMERHTNRVTQTLSTILKNTIVMEFYVFFVPLLGFGTIAIIEHLAKRDVNGWRQQLTNGVADSARVFTIYIMTVMFLKNGADLIQWLKLIRVKIKQMNAINERERILAYQTYEFRWTYEYSVTLTTFTVIFGLSVVYPSILLYGTLFMGFRYWVCKYNLLCFYCPVKKTAGQSIPQLISICMLTSIFLFQLLTCGVFLIRKGSTFFYVGMVLAIISFIVYCIFLYIFIQWFEDIKLQVQKNIEYGYSSIHKLSLSTYRHPIDS